MSDVEFPTTQEALQAFVDARVTAALREFVAALVDEMANAPEPDAGDRRPAN